MKIALDTIVLAYAEGANGAAMRDAAVRLSRARRRVELARCVYGPRDVRIRDRKCHGPSVTTRPYDLGFCRTGRIGRGGFRLLLSEDLQDGFTWRGVTVTNPFAAALHPLLAALLTVEE
jgi:hypothetical protein